MEAFIVKKFTLEIELKKGKTIFCEYEQGTMRQVLEFSEMITVKRNFNDIIMWFLNKNSCYTNSFFQKFTKNVNVKERDLINLNEISAEKILNYIMKTYAKGYFKEINNKEYKQEKRLSEQSKRKNMTPDGVFFAFIIEQTNETFESLMNIPYESIIALNEGIIWNLRSRTKEGQSENARQARMNEMRDGESIEEALSRAKDLERKLKLNKS